MCLVINKNSVLQQARKDVVGYKVVYDGDGEYLTPYQKVTVELNKLYHEKNFTDAYFRLFEKGEKKEKSITNDAIHFYADLKSAKKERMGGQVILAAVIPMGTTFVNGTFDYAVSGYPCYASEAVIYRKLTFWERFKLKFIKG